MRAYFSCDFGEEQRRTQTYSTERQAGREEKEAAECIKDSSFTYHRLN